jgi:protein O-GlcNAc transferase
LATTRQISLAMPDSPSQQTASPAPAQAETDQLFALFNSAKFAELESRSSALAERYPDCGFAWKALGISLKSQGKNALDAMRRAAELLPHDAEAHSNLGDALREFGQLDEALASCRRALEIKPDYAAAHSNLGLVLHDLGQVQEALASYRRALALKPDLAEAHMGLGNALRDLGQLNEAAASHRRALAIKPDHAGAHCNLGIALQELGQLAAAVASYRRALELKPDYAEAYSNLGNALRELGQFDEAVAVLRRALELKPDCAGAHCNLGSALQHLGHPDEALSSYRRALALEPDMAEAYSDLGDVLNHLGQMDEAMAAYRRALEIKPDLAEARWKLALAGIPLVAGSHEEIAACRAGLARELDDLDAWFDATRVALGYKAVGVAQPFYLAYQEKNNRHLLSRHGALCARLMRHWQERQAFPQQQGAPGNALKVGIVSAHIRGHSVWDAFVKGWFRHLQRERFELHVFHVGAVQDAETAWAKSRCNSFTQGPQGLGLWVGAILEQRVDVLIFPEIGMDPLTVKLAGLRIAPVQIAAWGHPETSGLPTIDYYLSAEFFEPPNAQDNYSEKLLALPGLGCHYLPEPGESLEADLAALGVAAGVPLLLCPGAPFKYAPEHDHVFVQIARALGACQFVFFTHHLRALSEKFRRRLEAVFAQADMDCGDFCRFVAWQPKPAFYGLMKRADVFLDTIGFSGFNTAMQAVECGLPIVTREGRFMRGRLAGGILRRMGMPELIADTDEGYINLAVKLARDAAYRREIRQRTEASRQILFDDIEPVRALEKFLTELTPKTDTPPAYPWQLLDADLHLHSLQHDYAPAGLLGMVSAPPRDVLDVGCFCGGSGRWLKKKFPDVRLTGIELLENAADIAREIYDTVIVGKFEDVDTGGWLGRFDTIVAADVLEHLYNPWAALERLKPLLAPGGAIYISLPNIRNLNILMSLAKGEWRYAGAGIMDVTHIRFFTKTQALEMLQQTGWKPTEIRTNPDPSLAHNFKDKDPGEIKTIKAGNLTLENLTREDVLELKTIQFYIRATPAANPQEVPA